MASKSMIFALIAAGAMSTSATAQMGTMSTPGMKSTSHTTAMPAAPVETSAPIMNNQSSRMGSHAMKHSRHHHHRMHHRHHHMHKM